MPRKKIVAVAPRTGIERVELPKSVPLTDIEKEVVIQYDRGSSIATIYTSDKVMITKLKKIAKLVENDKFGARFEIDKEQIQIGTNKRVSKTTRRKKVKQSD